MNDISGLPKGTGPSGPIPEEQPIGRVPTDQTGSVDMMVYEGTDTMAAAGLILTGLHLIQFAQKSVYQASIQNPELPPPDPDGQSGPQPYGMAEQRLVKNNISKQVIERLKQTGLAPEAQKELYDSILSGKPIKNPELAKLAKGITLEVEESIRKGARLPSSWTILSTSPKDWIPEPIQPYDASKQKEINGSYDAAFDKALKSYAGKTTPPLTPDQISKIVTAYASGKIPSDIADHFEAISKIATGEVQKNFGLPNTWFKGTTNVEDWKPVNIGIVTPQAVNISRAEFILENVEQQLKSINEAMVKVLDKLPPDDPSQIMGKEYQAIISKAIRELKAILREIQAKDAEKEIQGQEARAGMSDLRMKAQLDQVAKQKEAMEKQEKARKTSFIMKIVGPIIAALATIVGVLISIVTFGLATPLGVALVVAGIAVGVALTAYSIADSITGCTAKLMEALQKRIEEMAPGDELKQSWIKAAIIGAIVAALVIVIIIATVFSGGGAAVNVLTQTAAQAVRQAIMEAIKQLSIQMMVMVVMSSNAIPQLLGAILKANGVDEKTSKVWEIVMMAVTMIVAMIAIAKGSGGGIGGAAKTGEAASKGTVESIKQIGNQIVTATKELLRKMKEGIKAAVEEIIEMLKALIAKLGSMATNLSTAAGELLTALKTGQGAEFIKTALSNFSTELSIFATSTATAAGAALTVALSKSIDLIKTIGGKAAEALKELLEGFKEIGRGYLKIKDLFAAFMEYRRLTNLPVKTAEDLLKIEQWKGMITQLGASVSTSATKTLMITSNVVEASNGIVQGAMAMEVYHLLKQVGKDKEAQELLQAIIDQLNALLKNLSSGIEANMEALKGLNEFLTSFYEGQSEMSTKISRALQV